MVIQQASAWEVSIVAAISDELNQFKYLVERKSGSTERGDIHAQISRLCGLTGLAHNEAIPFAESTRPQIRELNEMAIGMRSMPPTRPTIFFGLAITRPLICTRLATPSLISVASKPTERAACRSRPRIAAASHSTFSPVMPSGFPVSCRYWTESFLPALPVQAPAHGQFREVSLRRDRSS